MLRLRSVWWTYLDQPLGREVSDMSDLVLLSGERAKREQADQAKLISGLRELLAMAENGEIKAVCYAAIDCNNDNVTLGVFRGEDIGIQK